MFIDSIWLTEFTIHGCISARLGWLTAVRKWRSEKEPQANERTRGEEEDSWLRSGEIEDVLTGTGCFSDHTFIRFGESRR
jgi:hypothetical protein